VSDNVLPVLPGFTVEPEISADYDNTEHVTISGKKQITNWSSVAGNVYRLSWETLRTGTMAPSPWGSYSEAAIIRYFFDVHLGHWDSWLMADPFTGSQVRVRWVEGSFRMRQIVPGAWTAEGEVETVK
jgi:hypothetical protein